MNQSNQAIPQVVSEGCNKADHKAFNWYHRFNQAYQGNVPPPRAYATQPPSLMSSTGTLILVSHSISHQISMLFEFHSNGFVGQFDGLHFLEQHNWPQPVTTYAFIGEKVTVDV